MARKLLICNIHEGISSLAEEIVTGIDFNDKPTKEHLRRMKVRLKK